MIDLEVLNAYLLPEITNIVMEYVYSKNKNLNRVHKELKRRYKTAVDNIREETYRSAFIMTRMLYIDEPLEKRRMRNLSWYKYYLFNTRQSIFNPPPN